MPTTSYSIPPASHFSLRAKQSLHPSAAASVTLVILRTTPPAGPQCRPQPTPHRAWVSPFTLHLGRRGKPYFYHSRLPTWRWKNTSPLRGRTHLLRPPVGGATPCACGLGGGAMGARESRPVVQNSGLGSRGHVIRRVSVPPGRLRASRDQPTKRARRLRVLGQLAAGRWAAAPQKRVSLWTTAVLLVEPLTSYCQQSSCLSLQLLGLWT